MSMDRVISSFSLVLTIAAALVAMTAVQRVEEMRDDMHDRELRLAAAPAEMPTVEEEEPAFTFGDRMNSFARRFAGLWFAARSGNTDLARYELAEMHEVIEGIESLNKVENGVNINGVLGALENTQLKALGDALEAGDMVAFDRAYHDTVKTCNACHSSSAHPFIQIKIPEHPPVVNRIYEPVTEEPRAVKVSSPD
jgi:hypothetical protein